MTRQVRANGKITLLTGAKVSGFERRNGHYRTTIQQGSQEQAFEHGALILATGGKEVIPKDYLYGKDPRVMTQRQLEKMIYLGEESLKKNRSVVMIQCVGSRDSEHPYCSRVCCGHAVKNALRLKEQDPRMNIYVLYRDVRTYGFYETYYYEARKRGVIFIRYDLEKKPTVTSQGEGLQISVFDPALGGPLNLWADRVVLSAGIEPEGTRDLAELFNVVINSDGFFEEANPKSAPLDSVDRGKFFCGLCHSPNHMEDAISQGSGAAARAGAILSKEAVEEKAHLAYVIKRLCCGCGLCVSVCPYGARVLNEEEGKAEVLNSLCQGCGNCVVACRNAASQQQNFEKELNMAVLDAALD